MPLNLSNGEFTPHIRWMASTSSWKISTEDGQEPLTWQHAIFDLAGIRTGWAIFAEGEAPQWEMDISLAQRVPRPPDGGEWKRGFKLNVFSESAFGGIREFATTATGAGKGIEELYRDYEAEAPQHPGKVPVVQFDGATHVKIGKGNTSVPKFNIVDWRDRPAELPLETAPTPTHSKFRDHQAPLGNEAAVHADPDDPIPINL